jgi:hypothetical protein
MTREVSERHTLVLERRIPETHSATAAEHRWHPVPNWATLDVTQMNFNDTMAKRHALMATAIERSDTEYRVVFVTRTETREVIS